MILRAQRGRLLRWCVVDKKIPNILSIAGSDPSGGAGVQADLKTFTALGCYGMAVMAALTAQNTRGVSGLHSVPADFVEAQMRAVFDDVRVDAVKIGMLGSADVVRRVATVLRVYKPAIVILDPVMVATSGDRLIDEDAVAALREELIPLATLVTPNGPEAEMLLGYVIGAVDSAADDLRAMRSDFLIKGGHFEPVDGVLSDALVTGEDVRQFDMPWIDAPELHGTGCTLSSALACFLALDFSLDGAVKHAQEFIARSIQGQGLLDVGSGAKPLYHGNEIIAPVPLEGEFGIGEFEAIGQYLAPLSLDGLKNDGVALTVPDGMELAVSTDTLNEGVHFLPDIAPEDLAHKALRVNLSDLASMGADPYAYQLSLSLPQGGVSREWWQCFSQGLSEVQDQFGIRLTGGDTTSHLAGGISVSVTAFGFVPEGEMISREGAKAGDLLCVSGMIGDALIGLDHLRGFPVAHAEYFVGRSLRPEPRVSLGMGMRALVHAMVDISDGLIADVEHMARASGLGAVVQLGKVPLSEEAKSIGFDVLRAVTAGDDYELAFAIAPDQLNEVQALAESSGVAVSVIGQFENGQGIQIRDEAGSAVEVFKTGWVHF